ncbi:MAG TPA: DoxX family protein [Mycobacteriales bacterium]|nr:DoxX family protein [Mycobacteriales bacterium]
MLGLAFIDSGIAAFRDDGERAERARRLGVQDPQQATRAVAVAQVGAGALLVLNRMPRLASLVLALTVVPDALTGHAFWAQQDKQSRQTERSLFARDLGLLGGLLVSAQGAKRKKRQPLGSKP